MSKKLKSVTAIFIYIIFMSILIFSITKHTFSNNSFNADNVYKNIETLSSDKFSGRKAGTEGNNAALEYVKDYFQSIGVTPGGDNGSYYQNFNTIMPSYTSAPKLSILDKNTNEVKNFKYGEDFTDILNGLGGSGSVNGILSFFDGNIKDVPKEMIKNHVLVPLSNLTDEDIEYAADNGCNALLIPSNDVSSKDGFNINSKNGKSIVIYKISKGVVDFLFNHINHNLIGDLNLEVSFKNKVTPNLLGKIEGTNKSLGYLLITADIDGVGKIGDSSFVPGSLHSASGVATMMELARIMKSSNTKPAMTVVFAAFNSHEQENLGAKYYIENPIYPLDRSQVISLDALGSKIDNRIFLASYGNTGEALMGKLSSYIKQDNNFNAILSKNIHAGEAELFLEKGIPAVLIYGDSTYNFSNLSAANKSSIGDNRDNQGLYHTTQDNMDNIGKANLNNIGKILASYTQREIYHDWFHDLLTDIQTIILISLITASFIFFLLKTISKANLNENFFKVSLKNLCSSRGFRLVDKFIGLALAFVIIAFVIVFITFIPPSLNIVSFNGILISNYSFSVIAQNAVNYMANFVHQGFGETLQHFKIEPIILFSIGKSILLIVTSLLLAFIVGTLSGTITGFSKKKNSTIGVLLTIALMSLPDVLIAIIFQLIRVLIYKNNLLLSVRGEIQNFLFSFLSLAIIPTAYIARISQTAANEEMQKDYINAAKSKGLSNLKIIKNHLLKSVSIKVVEALPSVLNIIISNLIIIEFFFNYHGIVYQIFSFYKDGDIHATIGLIIGMGIVYCILSVILKTLSFLINTEKRFNSLKESM